MDSSGHHFQLQSDGSILLRCGTDVSDANKLIIARDLLTVPVARQLGENTTMHAAVAPSNTVLLEKELVGTLQPKDDSDCGWNILFCADAPSQVPFFLLFHSLGKDVLARHWLKFGPSQDFTQTNIIQQCVSPEKRGLQRTQSFIIPADTLRLDHLRILSPAKCWDDVYFQFPVSRRTFFFLELAAMNRICD